MCLCGATRFKLVLITEHINLQSLITMVTPKPHAALLASPGMGHLIPMLELAKRLHTNHAFHVTIFVITTDSSTVISQIIEQKTSHLNALNIVVLPPVDVSTKLGPDPPLEAVIGLTMRQSLPFLRSSILSMKLPPSALIVDIFGVEALPMARDLGILTYVFFATSAWFSAVSIYLPTIDKKMIERHANDHEPLWIPGCKPIRFEDTVDSFLPPIGPLYEGYLEAANKVVTADGILMNTWQDLEPAAMKAVTEQGIWGGFARRQVYPVGPLVRRVESEADHAVLRWMDRQPAESVIYLSFGSGGTLSEGQMRELAWGLELSQQRFVWVVRAPNETDVSSAYSNSAKRCDSTVSYLPEGFLKRTEGVGVVVLNWAPQAEILAHPATGGFVTHCGWNSFLESVMNGVPMVAWPLYAEQKMNAFMLTEEFGVALRVEGGVVCRERIAELVRSVMVGAEGVAMRIKVKELKLSGKKALCTFGSSHHSLSQMRKDCEVHIQACEPKVAGASFLGDNTDHVFSQFVSS